MKLKVLYVVVIFSLLLGIAVPCFADSAQTDTYPLSVTPDFIRYYRASATSLPRWYTVGNPYVYNMSMLKDVGEDIALGNADTQNTTIDNNSTSRITTLMRYGWYYKDDLDIQNSIVISAFQTSGSTSSLDYQSASDAYVTPMQYHFRNIAIPNGDAFPIIQFWLTADASEDVIPVLSYRYPVLTTDGKIGERTVENRTVPFSVTYEDGIYKHTLSLGALFGNNVQAISELWIDFPFETSGTSRYYYGDDFGMRYYCGYKRADYIDIVESMVNGGIPNRDFFDWVFSALESLFTYPMFYVYNTPVTPFGVFSLTFGLALFAWFLKVFAGG